MQSKKLGCLILTIYVLLLILAIIMFKQKDKIRDLTKENNDLKEQISDYKWQIEQIPYVCMYGGD